MASTIEAEARKPNPVDLHVGARIRLRRKTIGISQEQLSDALGLTFQQVQKYENGANRVSASKLWDIARKLQVDIGYFFDGLDVVFASTNQAVDPGNPVSDLVGSPGGLEVARGYLAAPQQGRVAILAVARAFTAVHLGKAA